MALQFLHGALKPRVRRITVLESDRAVDSIALQPMMASLIEVQSAEAFMFVKNAKDEFTKAGSFCRRVRHRLTDNTGAHNSNHLFRQVQSNDWQDQLLAQIQIPFRLALLRVDGRRPILHVFYMSRTHSRIPQKSECQSQSNEKSRSHSLISIPLIPLQKGF